MISKLTLEQRLATFERRYLPTGSVVHLLSGTGAFMRTVAECGRAPGRVSQWRGTGSQEEYENAASWPVCKRCLWVAGIAP